MHTLVDARGRLETPTEPLVPPAVSLLGHDVGDRLDAVSDASGVVTTVAYDALGNRLTETSADARPRTFGHDAAGNVTSLLDGRGVRTTFAYDALDRLGLIQCSGPGLTPETVEMRYGEGAHGEGHLTSVTDASGTTVLGYDAFGNLISKARTLGGSTLTLGYDHDDDRLTTVTYPSGTVLVLGYDASSRPLTFGFLGITSTRRRRCISTISGTMARPAGGT